MMDEKWFEQLKDPYLKKCSHELFMFLNKRNLSVLQTLALLQYTSGSICKKTLERYPEHKETLSGLLTQMHATNLDYMKANVQ